MQDVIDDVSPRNDLAHKFDRFGLLDTWALWRTACRRYDQDVVELGLRQRSRCVVFLCSMVIPRFIILITLTGLVQ